MTIKEHVAGITADMDTRAASLNKVLLCSKLLALQAELQDDKTDVGVDVFESMTPLARKVALSGFVLVTLGLLQE